MWENNEQINQIGRLSEVAEKSPLLLCSFYLMSSFDWTDFCHLKMIFTLWWEDTGFAQHKGITDLVKNIRSMILVFIIRGKGEKLYMSPCIYSLLKKTLHVVSILWFNLGDREGHEHFCEQKKDIKDTIMWVVPNYFFASKCLHFVRIANTFTELSKCHCILFQTSVYMHTHTVKICCSVTSVTVTLLLSKIKHRGEELKKNEVYY